MLLAERGGERWVHANGRRGGGSEALRLIRDAREGGRAKPHLPSLEQPALIYVCGVPQVDVILTINCQYIDAIKCAAIARASPYAEKVPALVKDLDTRGANSEIQPVLTIHGKPNNLYHIHI